MERFFKKLNTVVILTLIITLSALTGISAEAISTPGEENVDIQELSASERLAKAIETTDIDYTAHVENIGWQDTVQDGALAGTTGQDLSLEALKIQLENDYNINTGGIEYKLHCENIGWTETASNGEVAGTTGEGLDAQAATINLTGDIASSYDVYYRVHSAYYGWFDWAKNGETAGTMGLDTKAEAIEIELVKKGSPAPGSVGKSYVDNNILSQQGVVEYTTYVGDHWTDVVTNGAEGGTTGQNLPMLGLCINTPNKESSDSSIEYKGYFSNIGWLDQTFHDGDAAFAGGQPLEAVAIALKGIDDYSYDLYYNVSVQDIGWLGFASEGQIAGTSGGGKAIEAIHILMLPKGSPSPQPLADSYRAIERPEDWRWPLDGYGPGCISSGFGWREGRNHDGVDILAPAGTPIQACKTGTVVVASWYYGYGQCVVVQNDTGEKVYYAHMSAIGTSVGARVAQGQTIGFVGMTGNATANHLHLGVLVGGNFTNPLNFF